MLGDVVCQQIGNWFYLVGDAYAIRLYNFGLSDEDVENNYDKTLAYRSTIKH